MNVKDNMTPDPATCRASTPLTDIACQMVMVP
jgi:hypothetical protein